MKPQLDERQMNAYLRGWSEKFSASNIYGNNIGKIFFLSWYICRKHPCENCKSFYGVVCFIQLSEARVLSVSLKMDKIEYRAVIKFFVKGSLTPNECMQACSKL